MLHEDFHRGLEAAYRLYGVKSSSLPDFSPTTTAPVAPRPDDDAATVTSAMPTSVPEKKAARVDRCKVCGKPAEVKVLWAEGHGYQPACEAHKEQVAAPFKKKDDFSGFKKYSDVATQLQPHQQRVVDRIQDPDQPGLVVIHPVGSGKSLSALAAQDALGMAGTAVVPASLEGNLTKEREKHLTGARQPLDIVSLQDMAAKRRPVKTPLMIVDEAHRARDPGTSTFRQLARSEAEKLLLLTGSPFYNHPADIAPLIDLAAHRAVLPLDQASFSDRYISDKKVGPGVMGSLLGVKPGVVPMLNQRRAQELRNIFGKWTDYHAGSTEGYPTVEHQDVKVPMSKEQLQVYDTLFKKAPAWVAWKVKHGLPPSRSEVETLNSFLSGARQVSDSTAPFQAGQPAQEPKIDLAFSRLKEMLDKDPTSKGVVYSNFLDAGIAPYRQRLQKANIPFGEFTGEQPQGLRDDLVRQYNAGKLRALLLSSAGGEGLDLKGTRLMQLLEPHWNAEKMKQIAGRGARYQSHADLPPEARKVLIEHYLATRPESGVLERWGLKKPGTSVDEYLTQLSGDKERLIDQFRQLLVQRAT